MSKKYSISEQRRYPGCRTKSYAKFLGSFAIYSYRCIKCGTVHSFCDTTSLELAELRFKNPQRYSMLMKNEIINILETAPPEKAIKWTDFDKHLRRLSKTYGDEKKRET